MSNYNKSDGMGTQLISIELLQAEIAKLTNELEEALKEADKKMFSHDAFRGGLEAAANLVEECEGLFSGDGIVAQNRNALKLAKAIRQIGG